MIPFSRSSDWAVVKSMLLLYLEIQVSKWSSHSIRYDMPRVPLERASSGKGKPPGFLVFHKVHAGWEASPVCN